MHAVTHEPIVVLVLDDNDRLDAHVARWPERLRARLFASSLDRQLAAGRSPDSSVALAVRARTLMAADARSSLAAAFASLAAPWSDQGRRMHLETPSRSLARARRELTAVSCRLASAPVSVRGIAQARVLLGDGGGPLYHPRHDDDLQVAARSILDALDPWPA